MGTGLRHNIPQQAAEETPDETLPTAAIQQQLGVSNCPDAKSMFGLCAVCSMVVNSALGRRGCFRPPRGAFVLQ